MEHQVQPLRLDIDELAVTGDPPDRQSVKRGGGGIVGLQDYHRRPDRRASRDAVGSAGVAAANGRDGRLDHV